MATTKPAVRIPVKLDTKEAKKEAQNFGKDMKRSFLPVVDVVQAARMAFDMARAALGQLTGLTKEAIKLAAEQERVEQRVMTVANMRAEFTKKDFDLLQEQNAARQQAIGLADEEALAMQSSAMMLGARAESLDSITRATIGLSRATGKNLARSMRQVMAIRSGEITTLKSMGIQVKDVSEALDVLNRMYEDAAAQTGTYAQMTDTLTANWGDLLEEFGRTVVENEDVKDFIQDMSDAVIGFASYVKENRTEISGGISEMVHSLRALGTWIDQNKEGIGVLTTLFTRAVSLNPAMLMVKGAKLLGFDALIGAAEKSGSMAREFSDWVYGGGRLDHGDASGGGPTVEVGPITQRRIIDPTHIMPDSPRDRARKARAADREWARRQKLRQGKDQSLMGASARRRKARNARWDREDAAEARELAQINQQIAAQNAWADARQEWQDQQKQGENEFWADMAQLGVQGVSQMFHGIASVVAGQQNVGEMLQKVFSDMMSSVGSMLIGIGSAALLANTSAVLVPWLWPYFGGPPGVGAALGIIAAGTALTAGGMLTAPSSPAGGAAAASRQVRRDATRSRRTDRPMVPGSGEVAPVGVVINFHQPVGSPRRTARAIADVMSRGRTLAPGYGG